jgi:hypothetical protein
MRVARLVLSVLSIVLLTAAVGVNGQTPAQMEYERQQREYWRQQEQQRQEQQRQQQQMQENARRQQEESRRLNAPSSPGSPSYGAPSGGASAAGGGAKGAGGDAAAQALSAARAKWEKQPPLPPERNPLLGRWTRPASTKANSSDPFAALSALAKGGLCEALFGGGVFEFRPDSLVGMDARTPEQELDRVEYRGDSKHVVVIPKTTLKLIEFDVESPERINWKSQNCVLVRAGPARSPFRAPRCSRSPHFPAFSSARCMACLASASGSRGVCCTLSTSRISPSPSSPRISPIS